MESLSSVLMTSPAAGVRPRQLFHLDGNVMINGTKVSFMGARNFQSLSRLVSTIRMENPRVYMSVFSLRIGSAVHIAQNGFLESNIRRTARFYLSIVQRHDEVNNMVKLRIRSFKGLFKLHLDCQPSSNEISISARGSVMVKMTWNGIEWTRETEAACLTFCNMLGVWIKECSTKNKSVFES